MSSTISLKLPPLQKFHEYLCSQDFYRDFREDLNEAEADDDDNLKLKNDLKEIPLEFDNGEEYTKAWEQLFFIECKAQILKAKASEGEAGEIFLLRSLAHLTPFILLKIARKGKTDVIYSYNDLVLITHRDPELPHDEHMIGIVDEAFGDQINIKTIVDRNSSRGIKIANCLLENSEWHVQKFCNVVTLNREFQALHGVSDLNLMSTLLSPSKQLEMERTYFSIPPKLNSKLESTYNDSQQKAIHESLKKEGVTLIQGPPGTGKTTTVLGIISVLLHSSAKPITSIGSANGAKNKNGMEIEGDRTSEGVKRRNWVRAMPWMFEDNYKNWLDDRDPVPDGPSKERLVVLPPKTDDSVGKPAKILICGPSNASIDEIVRIILAKGLLDDQGNNYEPSLVRLGPNVHHSLKHVSLEFLVAKEKEKRGSKTDDTQEIRNDILNKVQIVCSTLSITGSSTLIGLSQKFDTVVIDEAAQAVEISTLIPLKYDCKRLILIGDPKQLPATIFSKTCERLKYDRSLFQRLQMLNFPVHMLDTQYRMNPKISKFVSKTFYDSKLKDAETIMNIIGEPKIYQDLVLQPFSVFHIRGKEEVSENSFKNTLEAQVVLQLYRYIKMNYKDLDVKKIGIISPYSSQVNLIKNLIADNDQTAYSEVEVNTVDGFQGREKDIIVFSTVRSEYEEKSLLDKPDEKEEAKTMDKKDEAFKNFEKTIGFLKDERRMNVSLSRARLCLIIVGDVDRLRFSKNVGRWQKLIWGSIEEKRCFKITQPLDESFGKISKSGAAFIFEKEIRSQIKNKKNKKKKNKTDKEKKDGDIVVESENKTS